MTKGQCNSYINRALKLFSSVTGERFTCYAERWDDPGAEINRQRMRAMGVGRVLSYMERGKRIYPEQ